MSSSATPHGAITTGTIVGSAFSNKVTHYKECKMDTGNRIYAEWFKGNEYEYFAFRANTPAGPAIAL